jgi:hypothetical protein
MFPDPLLPCPTLECQHAVYIDIKLKIRAACPDTPRADIKALDKVDRVRKICGKNEQKPKKREKLTEAEFIACLPKPGARIA